MASTRKFVGVVAITASAAGMGGYILGSMQNDGKSLPPFHKLIRSINADIKEPLPISNQNVSYSVPLMKPAPVTSSSLTVGPHRTHEIMRYGFPTVDSLRYFSDYVLAYDRRNRTALWVMEHMTAERLADRSKAGRVNEFKEDLGIHQYFRSTNADYFQSGFDRGHLAAAGNHWITQESKDETFYLSNISPQVGVGFNRDAWNKLEQYCRHKTKNHTHVYVMTGPLYLPRLLEDGKMYIKYQVIGQNNVAVPTHFFKALLCQSPSGEFHLECFVMPNKPIDSNIPLQAFQVPPDSIERSAGFLLFEGLPKTSLATVNGRKT